MAIVKLADYLNEVVADHDVTLITPYPQEELIEEGYRNQVIHLGDDGVEERIGFLTSKYSIFFVTHLYKNLSLEVASTLMDFYFSPTKGFGKLYSFYWSYLDGRIYTVRFDCDWNRTITQPFVHGFSYPGFKFKILGKHP